MWIQSAKRLIERNKKSRCQISRYYGISGSLVREISHPTLSNNYRRQILKQLFISHYVRIMSDNETSRYPFLLSFLSPAAASHCSTRVRVRIRVRIRRRVLAGESKFPVVVNNKQRGN